MTSRQRIRSTLDHRQPDRVPIDFGSTAVTGIHVGRVAALREHYGLSRTPVKVHEPYQMLGWVDDDLADAMGIDTVCVPPRNTMFGFPAADWKPWRMNDGLEVLVPGRFNTTVDANGDTLIYPEGDLSAPPSGRMPKDGFYFDAIVRQEPVVEEQLDPRDNLEEFGPVSEADLQHFQREVKRASSTGRAVVATFGGLAFGDIALVPAPWMKRPKGIRDIAEWYITTVKRPAYVHAIFERQAEIAVDNLARIHASVGDAIDAVLVCGTDFGTQTSSFCSVETLRELYMPYYRRVNDWIHSHTTWKTMKHSCGAVEKFIPTFIESGFDILNPVQCSASGMEPGALKANHGERITFWGGGIDTQKLLPFGTPGQVRDQVLSRCETFAGGGGFVFNAIHNIQAGTPVENIVAMLGAVHEFNGDQ